MQGVWDISTTHQKDRLGWLKTTFKKAWLGIAIVIIFAAVLSSTFRALTPFSVRYKSTLEEYFSQLIGEKISISSMQTGWYWFEPVIKLKEVRLKQGKKSFELGDLQVGISLWDSLIHWQIQPGLLYVENLNFSVRQTGNQWQINGLDHPRPTSSLTTLSYQSFLSWVLARQKILFKHSRLTVFFQDKTSLTIQEFNTAFIRKGSQYSITGNAKLKPNSQLKWVGELSFDDNWQSSQGKAYFSGQNLPLALGQKLMASPLKIKKGQGDIELWLDWQKGLPHQVQSQIYLHDLEGEDELSHQRYQIAYMHANLMWSRLKTGWLLAADEFKLRMPGYSIPKNKWQITYQNDTQALTVYVKEIGLDFLLAQARPWSLVKDKTPTLDGVLCDTKLHFVNKELTYALTRFSKVAWQSPAKELAVNNLNGILHWQPDEGRLEIDSKKLVIKPEKQAKKTVALNGSFNWKSLSHGWHVNVEQFVINHPEFVFSANGALDDLSADDAGQVTLSAQLLAKNTEKWLTYLPDNLLKPKLTVWLKKNIKHIDQLVAQINVNGPAKAFPFDNKEGEFSIKGHVLGADIEFVNDWPLLTQAEAFLSVNKRLLDISIVDGRLQDIPIENGNVTIDDIGHDKEVLLLHTKIGVRAASGLTYILASPLKTKLNALKMLKMQGKLFLDLRLEAALYPENDEVLALGDITFKENKVIVNHAINNLILDKVSGTLQFDQEGILDSYLSANIMDYPVSMLMKSVRLPSPYVEVTMKAKTSIEVLRDKFDFPLFSLMKGSLWLKSVLIITDEPKDLDQIKLSTTLKGVAIALPTPFGKEANSKIPLSLNIQFNTERALRIRMTYGEQLSSDIWFNGHKGHFELQKGEIRLGQGQALWQKQDGLQVVGVLSQFNWQQWQKTLQQLSKGNSNNALLKSLQFIDVVIKQVIIGEHRYNNAAIQMVKLPKKEWSIEIKQEEITGTVYYQQAKHLLKGTIDSLRLKKESHPLENNTPVFSSLKVKDMPALDIVIRQLYVESIHLGKMVIKASTEKNTWQLDSCQMSSPFYQLNAKGQWTRTETLNQSKLQGDFIINDLAKTLEQWHMSPVIEAKKGHIQFQGHWPGAFHQFALKTLSGQMAMVFKNGRITHLSPETEEKLGLGKLLSILSLQTIPRRLKLDFSDLSHDGYSFDEFKGRFIIRNGLMSTEDSYINGPIAYASMKGDLDIGKQLYNLDLNVSPHVTASLPVVATIAGGPIAGIATWAISKIINRGVEKISAYTYKISGPWKQPLVQQVSIIRKKTH